MRRHESGKWAIAAAAAVLATVGILAAGPADAAASAPPPVSHITVTERTAHRITISYYVPAAYYDPGAGGVVRVTRGYTPAAKPTAGYAVPVTGRTARTTASPSLTADVVYTFAIWVRDSGKYSARRTITVHTRPDDVSAVAATVSNAGPTYGPYGTQIQLTWHNPAGPRLAAIRIVRNTLPTTAGGTIITLAGSAQSYVDRKLPASICHNRPTGCSTAPVHYWIIGRSTSGDYAEHYVRVDPVVGSRTITGTVSRQYHDIEVFCCPNPIDGSESLITSADASTAVNDGAFTVHVPPGVYTVCTGGSSALDGLCWSVATDGTGSAVRWTGEFDTLPGPSIDLRTRTSYAGIAF